MKKSKKNTVEDEENYETEQNSDAENNKSDEEEEEDDEKSDKETEKKKKKKDTEKTRKRSAYGEEGDEDRPVNYARSNVYKLYSSVADKFSGAIDQNLPLILNLFEEKCLDQGLAKEYHHTVFSVWLAGDPLRFYLQELKGKQLGLEEMLDRLKENFYTPERQALLLKKWTSTTLFMVINGPSVSSN